jgi:hypothetical protein
MTSQFAWLDHDDTQRRRMLAVVELFKEEGTIDEIGIGSIRDTIADALFPGTSVLHTRARYLLFVPWLLDRAARSAPAPDRATSELRRLEVRLIHALINGGETDGVIGRQAREKLKRMPSAAYWAATHRYGIRIWDTTIEGYFRAARAKEVLRRIEPEADDPGVQSEDRRSGLDPYLPPAPADLLESASFELRPEDADFLTDRMLATTKGSMLAWLLAHNDTTAGEWIWAHPDSGSFPAGLARIDDHGRRFHTAIHGAALLYNLLLAERRESRDLIDAHRDAIGEWRKELAAERPFDAWDRSDFWALLYELNPRISPLTRRFVDRWLDSVGGDDAIADDDLLRKFVRDRELQLKGGRARLVNQAALDVWRGASGLVRLDYRWSVARRLLQDICDSPRETVA